MGLFNNKSGKVPEIPVNSPSPAAAPPMPTPELPPPSLNEFPRQQSTHPEFALQSAPQQIPQPIPQTSSIMGTPHPFMQSSSLSQNIPSVTSELSIQQRGTFNDEQPFFVRIDKFSETKENFANVNEKVQEMERVLQSLELTKEEEEREIEEWKNDIKEMKSYLNSIDKEIFSKI